MRRFYLGPWAWVTEPMGPHWSAPAGFNGLDLRTLPQMSQQAGTPGLGLFWGDGIITDSEYTLIGEGSFYDIKPGQVVKDRIPKRAGYSLKGDDLVGIIFDLFTDGADPAGQDCVKPLMPGMHGRCELICGQTHNHRVRRGHGHWGIVRDLLRSDLKRQILGARTEAAELRALAAAINGKTWNQVNNATDSAIVANRKLLIALRNRPLTVAQAVTFLGNRADRTERQYRKVLDFTLEKYRIDKAEWQDLCPQDMLQELDPPEPHETSISDNFNGSDSDTMGVQLTWTELSGDWDIASNRAAMVTIASDQKQRARADHDLSSDDHEAQVTNYYPENGRYAGPACRMPSDTTATFYAVLTQTGDANIYLIKIVAGTQSNINSTSQTASDGNTSKVQADGSTIKSFYAGAEKASATDSAISGNVRCGLDQYTTVLSTPSFDDFSATDLGGGGGGILYTQLERLTHGYLRGVYSGS